MKRFVVLLLVLSMALPFALMSCAGRDDAALLSASVDSMATTGNETQSSTMTETTNPGGGSESEGPANPGNEPEGPANPGGETEGPAEPEGPTFPVFEGKELVTHLSFEDNITDACGGETTQGNTDGKSPIAFVEGYDGKGADFSGGGYVDLHGYTVDKNSFTMSFWMKTTGTNTDPVILTNKTGNWSGKTQGFCLALRGGDVRFSVGNGSKLFDKDIYHPSGFLNRWMQITVAVDREARQIRMWNDFGYTTIHTFAESQKDESFNGALGVLRIGQSGNATYTPLPAVLDEFMIFDGAFTGEDVKALAAYYGVDPSDSAFDENHEPTSTPVVSNDKFLFNYIKAEDLITYLSFDGKVVDATNKSVVSTNGTITYEDGVYGKAACLNEGYVSLESFGLGTTEFKPGMESFTISLFVKTDGSTSDPVLFGNKDWNRGWNAGFALICEKNNFIFSFGKGENVAEGRMDEVTAAPTDYKDAWTHILLVVDREAGEIKLSYNFGEFHVAKLNNTLKDITMDSSYDLVIGQDGTGNYRHKLNSSVDEFMMFNKAFSDADRIALAAYYGIDVK
ncbi:MAG: laminin G domain-containing protein [Clostridia bacterium]|nr:laminin G domain-containing protein [Clostridia bacterium]